MGLDRDDPVVRRRIAQKVEFIVDGATPAAPTAEELQSWLDAHADKYAIDATLFAATGLLRSRASWRYARQRRSQRHARRSSKAQPNVGDSTMLPATLERPADRSRRVSSAANSSKRCETLPVGGWQGPVRSGFGLHLVELRSREDGRKATLEEVREAVERDLLHARTEEAGEAFYERIARQLQCAHRRCIDAAAARRVEHALVDRIVSSSSAQCVFAVALCCFAAGVHADVFRPAYLELREVAATIATT